MSESNVFRERNYVVIIGEEDESKEESKTDESYLMIIQSYVTRILKKKLISGYEDIKREVQEMAQSRFRLWDEEFHKALDKLIEKGFVSWDDFEHYKYVE
jgi:hypothetical protein